ncbi:hypothetical protein J6590_029530 [Homalodisca vitripennis]|nr:hypothetical protein J6590_029530 [Homalodisca vitripennis]
MKLINLQTRKNATKDLSQDGRPEDSSSVLPQNNLGSSLDQGINHTHRQTDERTDYCTNLRRVFRVLNTYICRSVSRLKKKKRRLFVVITLEAII